MVCKVSTTTVAAAQRSHTFESVTVEMVCVDVDAVA